MRISLDLELLARKIPGQHILSVFERRGMDTSDILDRYRQFVLSAEQDVFVEVILSNYKEMVESELGRCMHEERVLAQRLRQEYRSPLAHNVRYLIEYMFLFTMSPSHTIDDIPIKLWERYMPDTFDDAIKRLWGVSVLPALP